MKEIKHIGVHRTINLNIKNNSNNKITSHISLLTLKFLNCQLIFMKL